MNVFVVGVLCTGKVDAAGEAHGWQGGEGLHHGGEGEEEGVCSWQGTTYTSSPVIMEVTEVGGGNKKRADNIYSPPL